MVIASRALLLPAVLLLPLAAACTFPDVDYAGSGGNATTSTAGGTAGSDGGGDAPVDGPCQLSQKCDSDADACSKKAQGEQKACVNKCKPPNEAACEMSCDAALAADLDTCVTQCVTCGESEGCAMQQSACAAIVAQQ
ncbi:MAG: hypothetical protein U0359_39745 [Byssovorax sp.]